MLQEAATDRLAPQILMLEKSLERAGNLMLELAQKFYQEPRILMLAGAGSRPKVQRFEMADILAGVQVKVETGSGLPRTRAGRQARVMQMLQMGLISPSKAYKYLDMADFKTLQAQFQADEEQAMSMTATVFSGLACIFKYEYPDTVNSTLKTQIGVGIVSEVQGDPTSPAYKQQKERGTTK